MDSPFTLKATIATNELGPPPSPPPIFVEKTKGSKRPSGALLLLVCPLNPLTNTEGCKRGACLWFREASGPWHTGTLSAKQIAAAIENGVMELGVEITIDPVEVQVEPLGIGWTQGVELASLLALAATP